MTPYLDAGFLLTLMVRTAGSALAAETIRSHSRTISLNSLHRLQVENFIVQLEKSSDAGEQKAGCGARALWQYFLAEGIFYPEDADLSLALRLALLWNNESRSAPPPPLLILHPALAAISGFTHFLSFDPRSRSLAAMAGLKTLPEHL